MNSSGTASALGDLTVGFSGMVPTPEERQEQGCSELDILMTVRRLTQRIFELGGRVVYGSHPTFTPIIESVALGMFGTNRPEHVTMLVARRYFHLPESLVSEEAYQARHGRYAAVQWIGTAQMDRQPALEMLRETLADKADALICIGGRSNPTNPGEVPGVQQEAELARRAGKPLYLLGWVGGYTRTLFDREFASNLPALRDNHLDDSENEKLGRQSSIAETVGLVIKGLLSIRAARAQAR
jgi:hypothetical protein